MGSPRWQWGRRAAPKKRKPRLSNAEKQRRYRERVKERQGGPWKKRPWSAKERMRRMRGQGSRVDKRPLQREMKRGELKQWYRTNVL